MSKWYRDDWKEWVLLIIIIIIFHYYYFFLFFFFLENSSIFLKLSSTFMRPSPVFTPVYFNVSDVKYV